MESIVKIYELQLGMKTEAADSCDQEFIVVLPEYYGGGQ